MFNRNLYSKYFIKAFLGVLFVNLTITGLLYFFLVEKGKVDIYKNYMKTAQINFIETKTYLDSKVLYFKNTINSIEHSDIFDEYLKSNSKENLVNIFKVLLRSNELLFQIRFIDKDGFEKIRIDKDNSDKIFENFNLQNKSSRYYFSETMKLQKDSFYISDLDLNIENGQIEIPYKPTIRVGKPIYRDNNIIGMLIINYSVQDIINKIKIQEFFNVYYIDTDYNFFLHPDEKKNYSAQLGKKFDIKDEIANIETILQSQNIINENSRYYISTISVTDNDFYIIYSLKDEIYDTLEDKARKDVLPMFVIVFFITIPIILYSLNNQASQSIILEAVIDNTPFPIFVKDINKKIVLQNTAFLELTGYKSKNMLIGKKISEVLNKDEAIKLDLDVSESDNMLFKEEIEIYSHNGKRFFYDIKLIKLSLLGLLKKTYVLGIAIDITDIKSTNLQLKEMVDEQVKKRMELEITLMQQSKMAEMGNMLANIIHQWKQPLNIISILSSTAELKINLDVDLDLKYLLNSFRQINEQVKFMNETSNDFKEFFSPDKQKYEFKVVEVSDKIERILRHRISELNVEIQRDVNRELTIMGYKNEFGQVLLSILNNAFDKFSNGLKGNIIKISLYKQGINTILKIADNGGIIPNEILPNKIFDKYFTTKTEGTGLGLSICKRIIENNFNGKVKAYNESGFAIFEICLKNDVNID